MLASRPGNPMNVVRSRVLRLSPLLLALFASMSCSSSDTKSVTPAQKNEDSGMGSSAEPDAASTTAPQPFSGDCSNARWANVTDDCWTCMCAACKPKLDVCNEDCATVFECAVNKHALVNVQSEITCEIRATVAECLQDPASQAAAGALLEFDTCLIGAGNKSNGEFRACDAICNTPYSGDVCTRFPAP